VNLRIVAGVVVAGFLSACVISTGDGSPEQGAPIDSVDVEAMRVDEKTAVDATDAFWRSRFPDLFGREYQPPRVEGGYLGEDGPRCGGQPSVPFNAVYCPAGDFIAWDENLMAAGFRQIGDAWVYLIIAHEWGHAIQARLDRSLVSVAAELQADCLAGATLQGAAQDGIVRIEPGDAEEIATTLTAVADDFPWTDQSDHGNAQQRISFFNQGVNGGVPACT
jgi:uncharacterized protein